MNSCSMKSRLSEKTNPTRSNSPADALKRIDSALGKARRVLVLSHVDPDGDAIGTQLALAEYLRSLGKDIVLLRESPVPDKYLFLRGAGEIPLVDELPRHDSFDTAVVLECPTPARTGRGAEFIGDDTTVINIDHHPDNRIAADINWLDSSKSSVGEMLFEYFHEIDFEITPEIAEQLYTAILTDTGRFRFSSTSPRTMEIGGALIRAGADPKKITDRVYHCLPPEAMKLLGRVLNGIEYHDGSRICILTLTREMLRETKAEMADSEGLVDFTLYGRGVEIGALLKEIEDDITKASLRSRDRINVAELAAAFGGGGHRNAAGCTMKMSLEKARQRLLDMFRNAREDQQ